MNGHDEYLELLAASIDFGLTEEEVARLNYHLASCPECRRAATELRGQNAVIATTPIAPLAPARSEQILRAALRRPAARPRWGMLAVAALLATLGGGVLFAGFQLINDDDPAPPEPPPSLVAEASGPPSATPPDDTAEPGAPDGGNPPPIDVPVPTPTDEVDLGVVDFEFPLPFSPAVSSVRVAPRADGRLWVSFFDGNGTVLALLDQAGAGSPIGIPEVEDCVPLAVPDGSVRLLCSFVRRTAEECESGCPDEVILAYTEDFEELSGFPVQLESWRTGSLDRHGARVIGTAVVVGSLDTLEEGESGSTARLLTVEIDGTVNEGFPLDDVAFCCAVGPDGIGYGTSVESHDDGTQTTTLSAIGLDGLVDGWPLPIEGTASGPAFAPDGDVYLTSWVDDGSRIVRVHDGTPVSSVDRPEIDCVGPEVRWARRAARLRAWPDVGPRR